MKKITSKDQVFLRPSIDFLFEDEVDLDIFFKSNVVDLIWNGGYHDGEKYDIYQACIDFLKNTETIWYVLIEDVLYMITSINLITDQESEEFLFDLINRNETDILEIISSL